jgi:hypothetical protein
MIDPTSIVSVSAALVVTCGKLSHYISTVLNKVDDVDTTLLVLKIEIDSLSAALGSVSVRFSDPSTAATVLQSLTGYEEEYWGYVRRSMNDCGLTLGALVDVFQSIKQSERRIIRSATTQTKLERKSGEIALLKQQITAYHKAMRLSLQLITMYNQFVTELILVHCSYETKTSPRVWQFNLRG